MAQPTCRCASERTRLPVYGSSGASIDNLRRRPDMPELPVDEEGVLVYLAALDKAIVKMYDEFAQRLQSYVVLIDTVQFGAAVTSVAFVFGSPLEDDQYTPIVTPTWDTKIWVTSIAATGFVINTSAAPGGAGLPVRVAVLR